MGSWVLRMNIVGAESGTSARGLCPLRWKRIEGCLFWGDLPGEALRGIELKPLHGLVRRPGSPFST